jgi:hypothetical protein
LQECFISDLLLKNKFKVLTSDPNYYYKYASFTILRNDSTLYISIKFPITTHGKLFQTYNVLSFPVEVNSTHNHATNVTGKIIFIRNKSTVTRNSENTKRASLYMCSVIGALQLKLWYYIN